MTCDANVSVKVCADFYTSDEVEKVRCQLLPYLNNNKRLPKLRGSEDDVCIRNVRNMVKIVLDSSTAIPTLCVGDLNCVPPIDIRHVDVDAILAELRRYTEKFVWWRNLERRSS